MWGNRPHYMIHIAVRYLPPPRTWLNRIRKVPLTQGVPVAQRVSPTFEGASITPTQPSLASVQRLSFRIHNLCWPLKPFTPLMIVQLKPEGPNLLSPSCSATVCHVHRKDEVKGLLSGNLDCWHCPRLLSSTLSDNVQDSRGHISFL